MGNERPGLSISPNSTPTSKQSLQERKLLRHLRVPMKKSLLPGTWGPTHLKKKHPSSPGLREMSQTLLAAQGSPNTHLVEKLSLTRSNSTLCTKPL